MNKITNNTRQQPTIPVSKTKSNAKSKTRSGGSNDGSCGGCKQLFSLPYQLLRSKEQNTWKREETEETRTGHRCHLRKSVSSIQDLHFVDAASYPRLIILCLSKMLINHGC